MTTERRLQNPCQDSLPIATLRKLVQDEVPLSMPNSHRAGGRRLATSHVAQVLELLPPMSDDAPRLTRSSSKRSADDIEQPLQMKSGLTKVFGATTLDGEGKRGSVDGGAKRPKASANLNDKAQQKKWANKREVRDPQIDRR